VFSGIAGILGPFSSVYSKNRKKCINFPVFEYGNDSNEEKRNLPEKMRQGKFGNNPQKLLPISREKAGVMRNITCDATKARTKG